MTGAIHYFIEPLDVLFLRGNKLFGDPGSFGESLVPPRPSVAAGALRSALLARKGVDLGQFAAGKLEDPELGTPKRPGPFRVRDFRLARRHPDGRIEPLHTLPADLVVRRNDDGSLEVLRMHPGRLPDGIASSAATALHAVLPERTRGKPEPGWWLTHGGWQAYLEGRAIDPAHHLVRGSELWSLDLRVGVGLDPERRSAAEGRLFTVQAVSLRKRHDGEEEPGFDTGFLVEIEGIEPPEALTLRFGGDGRGAIAQRIEAPGHGGEVFERIVQEGRCRMILTSPGIFPGGWVPHGAAQAQSGEWRFDLHGVSARLACAAVLRAEVASGWDLAERKPKPAQRVAPTGAVYWLEELKADAQALRKLAHAGLWSEPCENEARRAEGFNRICFAVY